MNDATVLKSVDGTIVLWNRAAAELFGYTAPDIIGQKADILISPGEIRHWRECEKRIRAGEIVRQVNAVRIAKGGVRISVILTATIVDKRQSARSEILEIYRTVQASVGYAVPVGVSL
jgi:PAS domain S-box-containing protein